MNSLHFICLSPLLKSPNTTHSFVHFYHLQHPLNSVIYSCSENIHFVIQERKKNVVHICILCTKGNESFDVNVCIYSSISSYMRHSFHHLLIPSLSFLLSAFFEYELFITNIDVERVLSTFIKFLSSIFFLLFSLLFHSPELVFQFTLFFCFLISCE